MTRTNWIIIGVVAAVGVGIFVATRQQAQQAQALPPPTPVPAPAPVPVPPAPLPPAPPPPIHLNVTRPAANPTYVQDVTGSAAFNLKVGDVVQLHWAGGGSGSWAIDQGGGLLPDSHQYVAQLDGRIFKAVASGTALLHWVGNTGSTIADVSIVIS